MGGRNSNRTNRSDRTDRAIAHRTYRAIRSAWGTSANRTDRGTRWAGIARTDRRTRT